MASPYSVLALDAAGRLDTGLAALLSYLDDAAVLLARDARTAFLLRAMETVLATARLLHEHMLDAFSSGSEASIELHARGLRARANIIMRAVNVLTYHERELAPSALDGHFSNLPDVTSFLADQVTQIFARWTKQYAEGQPLDAATRSAFLYTALDEADVGLARLSRHVGVATFLRVGAASNCEPVRNACREIATAIGLNLAVVEVARSACTVSPREGCVL